MSSLFRLLDNPSFTVAVLLVVPDCRTRALDRQGIQTGLWVRTEPLAHLFSSGQLLSCVWLFATPWIAARQASLSITNSQSSPKLMCIELVMPSSHLILYHPLLLLPPIPPSIRVFSNEPTLRMRWPKYWSFSIRISPFNKYSGLIFFRTGWFDHL